MKLIDFAFTSHLSSISPGNFFSFFSMKFLTLPSGNFSMKQEICVFIFTITVHVYERGSPFRVHNKRHGDTLAVST